MASVFCWAAAFVCALLAFLCFRFAYKYNRYTGGGDLGEMFALGVGLLCIVCGIFLTIASVTAFVAATSP